MKQFRWKIAQWFEDRWWRNYLKNKTPQDYLDWKTNYWEEFLIKIGINKDEIKESVIDIGCGPAGIFTIFKEQSNVAALDPLLAKYEENLTIFKGENYPKTTFINTDFESAEISNEFQTVFCLNAINHFIDLPKSYQKLHQITQENGTLVLSIDAHNYSFFKYLFRSLPLDILHPHQYDLKEYIRLTEKAGYKIERKICIQKEFFFDYWVLVATKI